MAMYTQPNHKPLQTPKAREVTSLKHSTRVSGLRATRPNGVGYANQVKALSPKSRTHHALKCDGFIPPKTTPITHQLAPIIAPKEGQKNPRSSLTPTKSNDNIISEEERMRSQAARLYLRLQAMGYDIRSSKSKNGTIWVDNRAKTTYTASEFIGFAESVLAGTRSHVRPDQFSKVVRHFERWARTSYFIPCERDLEHWTKAQWPKPRLRGEIVQDNNPIRAVVSKNTKAVLPGLKTLNTIYSTIPQLLMAGGAVANAFRFGTTAAGAAEEIFGLYGGSSIALASSRSTAQRPLSALQQEYVVDKILRDQFIFFRFINRFYPGTPYDDAIQIFALCEG